jgi:hypothetical protein
MTTPNAVLPQQIYVIRHGEKPADPVAPSPGEPTPPSVPPFGVDVDGNQSVHSLLPRGWQRSGALAVLFDPAVGAPQAGLRTPTALYSPLLRETGQPNVVIAGTAETAIRHWQYLLSNKGTLVQVRVLAFHATRRS